MLEVLDILEIRNHFVPLSLKNYRELCEQDPTKFENTEFFRGLVLEKMTKSLKHDYFSGKLIEILFKIIPSEFHLRIEKGIELEESELEPDISIISGNIKNYKFQKPKTARLVVEIAISSLVYDRNKALDYSKSNVEEYWIVDLEKELIEVYTIPTKTGFKEMNIYTKEESLEIFNTQINLKDFFD